MKLHLTVLTPEKEIYSQEVDEVIVPTTAGVIGILPLHTPLVSQITPGELQARNQGNIEHMAVFGGFVNVTKNTVSILADYASHVEELKLAEIEKAKERAERLMREKVSDQTLAKAEADLQRALLELRLVKKYRTHN